MAEGDPPPPKRVRLTQEEFERIPREQLLERWFEQEAYVESLLAHSSSELSGHPLVTELNEKVRQIQQDSARRENVLVMRLTAKEQELQEYVSQNEELKRAQNPSTAQLRNMLLDPAINLMFQRMKKEMEQCKEKLEQAQNDLAAWKFTPDGQTGKRLMAKCRMLLQENAELGRVISAGRTAKLEGEIALGKKFVEELKKSQADTDEFLVEMDEDVEGLQNTIYLLQQELREAKDEVSELRNGSDAPDDKHTDSVNRTASEEEHMDSLAGEQRTSHFTGNSDSNLCSSAVAGHRHTSSSLTTNGSHRPHMETDSHEQAETRKKTTSSPTDGHRHLQQSDDSTKDSKSWHSNPDKQMEVDGQDDSYSSRTSCKSYLTTNETVPNGMIKEEARD